MTDIETHKLLQLRGALTELVQERFDDPVLSTTLRRHVNGALKAIDQAIYAIRQADAAKAQGQPPGA